MEQIARNLVDVVDGFLLCKRYVLADRDPLYTEGFREMVIRVPHAHPPDLASSRYFGVTFVTVPLR